MFFFREKARTKVARFARRWMVCSAVGMVLTLTVADRAWADNDDQSLYYYSVHQEVERELEPGKHDLVDWAAELLAKKPKTVREALVKIDVLLRAGLSEEVVKTMTDLPSLYSDPKNPRLQENIQHILRGAMQGSQAPDISVALVEAFPEKIDQSMRSCMGQLFHALRGQGWDGEKIDEWIVKVQKKAAKNRTFLTDIPADFQSNPSYRNRPWQIRHHDRPGTIWVTLRIECRQQIINRARFIGVLEEEVKKDPTDTLGMLDYLWAWRQVPNHHQFDKSDPSWVAEVAEPKTSLEACSLGTMLSELQKWKPAKTMFQKAEELLEKAEETPSKRPSGKRLFMKTGGDDAYREHIDKMLKRCDSGLRSSVERRQPAPIASTRTLMTSTSTASSTALDDPEAAALAKRKEEEKRILDEEKQAGDKPSYWLRRGEFYARDSYQQLSEAEILNAKQAFEKGLELTDPEADPQNQAKYMATRKSLLQAYTNLLRDGNQHDKVMEILLKELQVSKDETIIHLVTQHGNSANIVPCIEPDEPVLWQWLEKKKVWEHQEGLLLDILAKRAFECFEAMPPDPDNEAPQVIYDYVTRVEKLAKEGHASRMEYCSRMLLGNTSLGIQPNPDRLLPLIQEKLKQKDLNDGDHLQLESNLFQAYLKSGQIKEADALFKDPKCRLSGRVLYQKLARMAATKNENEIALRNWRRSANYSLKDASQIQLNTYLLRYGLRDEIKKYYQDAKKKLPTFEIPKEFVE